MLSLTSLAGWEDAVLASLRGASGTLDEQDRQIERSGLYGEYPAIVRAYIELFEDEESSAEAIKRSVFLVWRGAVAPPNTTGIAALPDGTSRVVIEELDARVRRGVADHELGWMLAWYNEQGSYVFDLYGGTRWLVDFATSRPFDAWRTAHISDSSMRQRGQLGRYWMAQANDAP